MADTKITALTALTAADPSTDVLPIVDTSDTTMAASGTTKKISINNILGASGTATLASATITGDLTVDTSTLKVDSTNNRVGIGTATPAAGYALDVRGVLAAGNGTIIGGVSYSSRPEIGAISNHNLGLIANNTTMHLITPAGVFDWYDGAGGTRMTLNATGLGVGTSPTNKLTIGTGAYVAGTLSGTSSLYSTVAQGLVVLADGFIVGTRTGSDRFILDTSGNVGISVVPSAWNTSAKAFEIGTAGNSVFSSGATFVEMTNNAYLDSVSNWVRVNTGNGAARFRTSGSGFLWAQAAAGANPITWTTTMQLDSNGNLILQSSATPATLTTNGQLTVNATSNTNLRFSYRGSDGVTRTADITLA